MDSQRKTGSLCFRAFAAHLLMLSDRRLLLAALVCAVGVLCAGASAQAQAPAPSQLPLDEQAKLKGDQLVSEGKYAEAAASYEEIVTKYPTSQLVPEANLRAGSAHYSAGNYDKAAAIFKKVLDDKKAAPELAQLAASLLPQVSSAKAAKLKDPERKLALEEAIKQFDQFLAKYPAGDEVESANYGKAMAFYQLGKYPDAATALQTNMQKFAASTTVLDSQYLLALTIATVASQTMQSAGGESKKADVQFDEAERLLRDIVARRQNLAQTNDAQFQLGELLLARAGGVAGREKQSALFGRALEAYRSVLSKEAMIQLQQQYVASLTSAVSEAAQNPPLQKKLRLQLEKEQQKLGEFKQRGDQTVTARIRSGQIYSQLGRHDETRVVMSYLDQAEPAAEPEQKKLVLYYLARSYAAQKLTAKAEEKYNAFQASYKGDPIAQDLPLLMGAMFLSEDPKLKDPDKAMKYFEEAKQLYPDSKVGGAAVLMQAQAMMARKQFDEALKVLNDTLAKNPPKELAVDAEFFRAALYAQTGRKDEAIAAYKKVRDTYRGTPQAEQSHYQIGQLLSGTDAKAAVAELQSFITKFPASPLVPAAIFELGKAQAASGQPDAARATFKDLAAKHPKSAPAPYTFFERAKILNGSQQLDECLAVMREYTDKYSDNAALLYQAYDFIAQIHNSRLKTAEAVAAYEAFTEKHPQDPNAAEAVLKQSTLWKAYAESQGPYLAIDEKKRTEWRTGLEKSTAAAERVLENFPDSPAVALALKNLLAVQRLQQMVKLKSEADVEKYFGDLGVKFGGKPGTKAKIAFTLAAFLFEKDKAKAFHQMEGTYKADLRFAPEDLDLYGLALIDGKKFDEAIKVYEKLAADYPLPAAGTAPRDVQEAQAIALAGLGKAMQEKGDIAGGAAKFAELEKLYPWSPKMLEVNYGRARELHDKKQDDDAMKRLREVIMAQRAPADLRAKAMLLLGRIHEDNGRFTEAIDNYVMISVLYNAIQKVSAEGLWRGGQLLERQARGEIPMPTPRPVEKTTPKPAATPAPKPAKP